MNYTLLPLTAYMILHIFISIDALITREDLARVSEVYERIKASQPELRTLTYLEIEAVMLAAQETESLSNAAESYEEITQCQPRPRIMTKSAVLDTLLEESHRVTSIDGYFTTSISYPGSSQSTSCLLLYRCDRHAGCCPERHTKCDVKSSEEVNVDVTVHMYNGTFVQQLSFQNHTECGCQRPTETQCACPHPFEGIPKDSTDKPCDCQCKLGHETKCQQVYSGSHSIEWSQARLRTFTNPGLYQLCYEDSLTDLWNQPSPFMSAVKTFCPHLACAHGLTFNPERLKCVTSASNIQSNQSIPATEHRTSREIDLSDCIVQTTAVPDITSPVIPHHSSSRRAISDKQSKKQAKSKRKIKRKLKRIQSKGLVTAKAQSELGQRIFDGFNKMSNNGTIESPGDIIIIMNKQRASVICKPLPRVEYHVLPLESHFLFCSIDVP